MSLLDSIKQATAAPPGPAAPLVFFVHPAWLERPDDIAFWRALPDEVRVLEGLDAPSVPLEEWLAKRSKR